MCQWLPVGHARRVVGKGINFDVDVPDVNNLRVQIITLETTFYAETDECPIRRGIRSMPLR